MKVYECRPGNMPEDIILDKFEWIDKGLALRLRISNSYEEIQKLCKPKYFQRHTKAIRLIRRKHRSWCGEHPRYWRELEPCEV